MSRPDDVTAVPDGWLTSSDAISHGRFPPGTILVDRYRIIGLAGKGGMGEVYRADDLKLGQQVALKFLPGDLAGDPARLARFHTEVRLARQISHPNVCRVYDVGEVRGDSFLSMEYVDGEDLSSLLRRIGRLPQDKATEMARQLCAGVAAAHARGVLHRDLKPANVMIDGRGSVRVLDFGLAVAAGTADVDRAGTPAYMAPEQLTGGEVTVQSDVYALGLLLFEMFTGRRANSAGTVAELLRLHESDTTTRPTTIVPDLDPAIERAILRCLEREPLHRPASALAVSAALPGGDPLAAALEAGETPSPAMVAAAAHADAVPSRVVLACLGVVAASLLALPFIADRVLLLKAIPPAKAVDVLVDRAQTLRSSLGYSERPRDEFYAIEQDEDYLRYLASAERPGSGWTQLQTGRPAPLVFWYRSSPRPLAQATPAEEPSRNDPPFDLSGMTGVMLDLQGRLISFSAVPPQRADSGTPGNQAVDWSVLFKAAELPFESFKPVTPEWTPRTFADVRAAWEGVFPERPDVSIRVEAAAFRGRPVFFQVIGPWTRPEQMEPEPEAAGDTVISIVGSVLLTGILLGAIVTARQHLRSGRADRRSAARLAATVLVMYAVSWVFGAKHFDDAAAEINGFFLFTALVLLVACFDWLFYLALEPLVRKWNPRTLVGWTRLTSGAVHDPHVGLDVLVGVAAGSLFALCSFGGRLLSKSAGAVAEPVVSAFSPLIGVHKTIAAVASILPNAIGNAMLLTLAFAFLRMLLGRTWLAAATIGAAGLAVVMTGVMAQPFWWLHLLIAAPAIALILAVTIRFGLLATMVMFFVWVTLEALPLTADPTMRYFWTSTWTVALVLAVAIFAAHASRAGQPLFSVSKSD